MRYKHNIEIEGRPVPILAFFGTRGGVGKSTISQYIAELLLSAPGYNGKHPNILLIDMDVNARQLTLNFVEQRVVASCPTIHELVRLNDADKVNAINITSLVDMRTKKEDQSHGELFFMPSAKREHKDVYSVGANADPEVLCELLSNIIQNIVTQNKISCVVIDCTAVVDNYTAAAATIADVAFCVSMVEPNSFDRIDEQGEKIAYINNQFDTNNLKAILNKFQRKDRIDVLQKTKEVFHSIPFTDELLRGEGFEKPDEMRLAIFKDYIAQLCEKMFRHRWPELVPPPSVTVPAEIAVLSHVADKLEQSPGMKRLRILQHLKLIGIILISISVISLLFVNKMQTNTFVSATPDSNMHSKNNNLDDYNERSSYYIVLSNTSIVGLFIGLGLIIYGIWASRRYKEMIEAINSLKLDVVWVLKQLENKDMRQRQRVRRLLKLALKLPETKQYLQSLKLV